jgi:WD40 repeat protein
MLASGADDTTVRLWDPATGRQAASLTGHSGRVWSVAFSPDGTMLASGADDGTIRLWEVATHSLVAMVLPLGNGSWAFVLPDGGYKTSGIDMRSVMMWWAVKLRRFEAGEVDGVGNRRRLEPDEPIPAFRNIPRSQYNY